MKAHVDREAPSDWFQGEDEMFRVGSEGRNQALAVGAKALGMYHLGQSENKQSLLGKARWKQPSEGGSNDHEKYSADDKVQSPQPKRRRVLHKKVVATAEGGSSELQVRDGALRGVSKKSGKDGLLLKSCNDNPNKKSGKKQKEITVEMRIINTGEPIGE